MVVYRGAKLSNIELDQFKNKQGQLISTNGFLSTSRSLSQALSFAMKSTKRSDAVPVLFNIKCHVQELGSNVIFADISHLSVYPEEEEVLFDLSAAFQVQNVKHDGKVWVIEMTATSEGQVIIQDYLEATRRETEERSVGIMFGRLMCNMGQYEKSQRYFEQLVINSKDEHPAWVEFNIGRALHFKGEWKKARKYYDNAYHRMMNADPPRIKDSAYVLNNIGAVLKSEGKYGEALDFYQRALIIREKYYPTGHLDTSASINNIGRVFEAQGKLNRISDHSMAILSKYKLDKYQFGTDVRKGQQLYGLSGKIIYEGKWISRRNDSIIIVEMNEAIAEREASFYLEVNGHHNIIHTFGCVENSLNLTIFVQEFAELADLAGVLMDNQFNISQTILVEISIETYKHELNVDVKQLRPLNGKFYEAEWIPKKDQQPIVLMIMNEETAEQEALFYTKFEREPHIVDTFGFVKNDRKLIMLLLERASHGDLQTLLENGEFQPSEKVLVAIFLQIIEAMIYIISHKTVHGDLRCANVLVFQMDAFDSKRNFVKLTNFTMACPIDHPVSKKRVREDLMKYYAPEICQFNDRSIYTELSDVYSMGVLMWQARSKGAIPFSHRTSDGNIQEQKSSYKALPKPKHCNSELWSVIETCCCNEPSIRDNFEKVKTQLLIINFETRIHYDYKLGDHVKINGSLNRPLPAIHQAEWLTEETSSIVLIERKEELSESEKLLYTTYKKHDHLVYTYGFVENNRGSIMILQEKAPHGNLRALLESGQFNPSAKVLIEIFFQILDAMIHIVDHGLVHGDLRCENVLVFEMDPSNPKRNRVKLGNFALAHENDPSLVDDRRLVIPVRYCAPEILRSAGRSNYSELSDVYSMGVLMWQAWSNGKLPYESSTHNSEIRQRKLNGEILSKPFMCDPQIWAIMRDCWNKELICRFDFSGIKTRLSQVNIA
ncbi:unnamed protein product [Rotaria sp. Silwood1]|nr:unnamed protein product [Rotaria sp. Silwood1]